MSNDTQVQALMYVEFSAEEKERALQAFKTAHANLGSAGTFDPQFAPNRAWLEGYCYARAVEASARQLAEQPGFVMVPVEIVDRFPEINTSNYDHDDACALNAWGVELVLAARPLTASPTDPLEKLTRISEELGLYDDIAPAPDAEIKANHDLAVENHALKEHIAALNRGESPVFDPLKGYKEHQTKQTPYGPATSYQAVTPEPHCRYPDCKCPTESPCLQGLPPPAPVLTEAERWRFLLTADHPTVCVMDDESGEWLPVHPQNIQAVVDQAIEAEVLRRAGGGQL